MLFLSSGTVDGTLRSTATSQQHQGKTVYHISVVLKETQRDATEAELGMGRVTHTLVEDCQPGGEIISIVPMENSPRLGRTRPELDRWPSLSCTGRTKEQREEVVVEENEEELEEAEGKMKTDRFLKQPSKDSCNSSKQDRDVQELAAQTDTGEQRIQSSSLGSVTVNATGQHGTGAGHGSLSRAVLRRPRQDEARLARKAMSMYGDSAKQTKDSQPDQDRRLRRPRSVCMLAGPGPVLLESRTQNSFKRAGILENEQQCRSRKAELRAVDGLNPVVPRPLVPAEVTPRGHQRSWKPRPVSMTVLELRKRGSDDEIDSQRSCTHVHGDGGGLLKGGFRWRIFGKPPQDKSKERECDKDAKSSLKFNKSDAPKSTLSSLRRSLSLRIRRTRPKDKVPVDLETESKQYSRTKGTSEEAIVPPRPFSYLTGRMLPPPSEQSEDGGMQYIEYHSKGKIKVMEVPVCPKKLSSKPVQEEPSIWQLIAKRFRRTEQPFSGKCETQLSQSKGTGQYSLAGNNKSQPVAIETLSGIDSHKGQGKTCKVAEFLSFSIDSPLPFFFCTEKKNPEVHFFKKDTQMKNTWGIVSSDGMQRGFGLSILGALLL